MPTRPLWMTKGKSSGRYLSTKLPSRGSIKRLLSKDHKDSHDSGEQVGLYPCCLHSQKLSGFPIWVWMPLSLCFERMQWDSLPCSTYGGIAHSYWSDVLRLIALIKGSGVESNPWTVLLRCTTEPTGWHKMSITPHLLNDAKYLMPFFGGVELHTYYHPMALQGRGYPSTHDHLVFLLMVI